MSDISLPLSQLRSSSELTITGSKSETNRLLLLKKLYPELEILNTSNSDDSVAMIKAFETSESEIDIHHAGTAMRFLTAYYALCQEKEIILTGSPRMQERPIKILVEALQQLGADIQYTKKEGFPPLHIKGKITSKHKVEIKADVSSQYISALILIAPKLKNGLELSLIGNITSLPYVKMTLSLLDSIGVETSFKDNRIKIHPLSNLPKNKKVIVESDWSSASYYYSLVALSKIGTEITLNSYKKDSLQGDSILAKIYKNFGVKTTYEYPKICIEKVDNIYPSQFEEDLVQAPDIAQTIAVTCAGLGIGCHLTGLHTLKIKETDRLNALKTELQKLGAKIQVSNKDLILQPSNQTLKSLIAIDTYNDHRMAMAFAPLALCVPVKINNMDVVSKSYPEFWKDLLSVIKTVNI